MNRRQTLVCLLCIAVLFFAAGLIWSGGGQAKGEEKGELVLLTWNIPSYEPGIRGWISDFEAAHPGSTVRWDDKKGSEWATYFQTQLAAGTEPDVFEIQGQLWVSLADMGALQDLTPYLNDNPAVRDSYDQNMINDVLVYQGKHWMVPFFMAPTVIYYNKLMFGEAGLSDPPETMEELYTYARKLTLDEAHSGFLTLNFDWHYWPLLRGYGVELLSSDNRKAAFNTPAAVRAVEALAELTQSGAINKLSWTGRWKEPNDAFAAGNVGMYHANGAAYGSFKASAKEDWINPDSVWVASFPGGWAVPNYHAMGISSRSDYPDLAWDLVKIISNEKWAEDRMRVISVLSGNADVNEKLLNDPQFRNRDKIRTRQFEIELENMGKLTGNPPIPQDERVKEVFYTNLQKALFGEVSAKEALDTAEEKINEILAR
jgi:ABC-type glycerol-3-phosphate transport system substrate-binding protein